MYEVSTRAAILKALEILCDKVKNMEDSYNKYLYVSNDAPFIKDEIEYLTACAVEIHDFLYGLS